MKPTEKRIDWETLFDITYNAQSICEICEFADKCRSRNRPPGCPIWASLPEVDSVSRDRLVSFIDNWEPRESGHHGALWHVCQDLRAVINYPGCNCDECNF